MYLTEEQLAQLETPCVVIDAALARKNCRDMQREADQYGCLLRPHVKTHKMPLFAHMQLEEGAAGITCCKVSEAEIMAQAGIQDIFIAYPLVGRARLARAMTLRRHIQRLILGVDSLETARLLQDASAAHSCVAEVRLEIDTGAGRTGVPREKAVELTRAIQKMPNLKLTGIYTFKGLVYQGQPTTDLEQAAQEEGELMAQVAEELRAAGAPVQEISAGSTPTGAAVAKTKQVTEIRPGTYIFNDYMLTQEGHCAQKDIAVRIYATVVSTAHPEYAVLDGGTKTFPTDIPLDVPPYYYTGYAIVEGNPDLELRRMNEEHGILISRSGKTGLRVGDIICLLPVHVCTAINLQNQVYLLEDGTLRKIRVSARGTLL